MDFPLKLDTGQFLQGMDEYKQDIEIILTEPIRNFMQSTTIGAKFDVHTGDETLIRIGVEESLKEIPGVSVSRIEVQGSKVYVECKYFDDIINFQFNIEDENTLTNNQLS